VIKHVEIEYVGRPGEPHGTVSVRALSAERLVTIATKGVVVELTPNEAREVSSALMYAADAMDPEGASDDGFAVQATDDRGVMRTFTDVKEAQSFFRATLGLCGHIWAGRTAKAGVHRGHVCCEPVKGHPANQHKCLCGETHVESN
jgi:hypothetical protein